ncbi:MAG: DUF1467 family protein [Neomegalonema sp.]|nr:DUF1467 family protein [Neomegalonema sp.]
MHAWSVVGSIVLYAVMWWIVLLLILPRGVQSQGEAGSIEPGTPASAPARISIKRKLLWASLITLIPWAIINGLLFFEVFSLEDFSFLFPDSFKEPPVGGRGN